MEIRKIGNLKLQYNSKIHMGKTSCFCIDNTVFPVFHDGNKRGAAEILVPDLFGNIVLTERLAAMKGQIKSTLSLSLSLI